MSEQPGKFDLIKELAAPFQTTHSSSVAGIGEDASVVKLGKQNMIFSSKLFVENIHFDLTYFPLKHLGYKCVIASLSDVLAMNGIPTQIRVNLSISNRFSIEAVRELMDGIRLCCQNYKIDLLGLDVTSSQTGLTISTEAIGAIEEKQLVRRSGNKDRELICVTGDVGAAYTGLIILEREKKVFEANPEMQPDFAGHEYLLEKQLKPEARFDIIRELQKADILPTSMINVTDGIASALIHICNASHTGCTIYENKIPVDTLTFNTLKEMKLVATTVALNGGEDYELLFTIKQEDYEKIEKLEDISIIGYIHEESAGRNLITNDEHLIELKAQGF